ncbi:MAG: GAF domain-containing protein [Coriobacteriia bacterium]|nr:GAF domain-containing protein [Coriobacteriia bacterium]
MKRTTAIVVAASALGAGALTYDMKSSSAAAATTAFVVVAGMALGLRLERGRSPSRKSPSDADASGTQDGSDALLRQVAQPSVMDADSVVAALLENAGSAGEAVAAHVWLEDAPTGTLRPVARQGTLAPASTPVAIQGTTLGAALVQDRAIFEMQSRVSGAEGSRTLWRYAAPIGTADVRGVAAVDIASDTQPSGASLRQVFLVMRTALTGALALHLGKREHLAATRLMKAARVLARTLDEEGVIRESLAAAVRLADAATASIMLLSEDDRLRMAAAHGLPDDVISSTVVSLGEGIAGWVAATNQPVLVEDLPGKPSRGERHGVRSAVSVPISDEDGLLGVLNVGSRRYPAHFTKSLLDTLELLGRQTAVALRNARAIHSAEELYLSSLRALALALETKDPYAHGGTDRVAELTMDLGSSLGLDDESLRALQIAAILHDIGMAGAGSLYAASSRPLTTIERGLVKMHPEVAADILQQVPALRKVAPIVYHHHERFDGSGYVAGVAGEDIPLEARILAVADAYVAMTSERPYRKAFPPKEARREIEKSSGTQFDPEVVRAFMGMEWIDRDRSEKGSG